MRITEWLNDTWITISVPHTRTDQNPLEWGHSERTEEGWNSEYLAWWQEDGKVFSRRASDGVDCDGRMSWDALLVWNPMECWVDFEGQDRIGRWAPVEQSQRDYSAEAMGY